MLSETKQINRLQYKTFCPKKDKQAGKQPVLCFLHGNGEHNGNLTIQEALEMHGPLKNDTDTHEALGDRFIVIFPQLPAPGGNVWGNYADDVSAIVASVQAEYGGDPNRTYLTGFSYGGNGVFSLATKQPGIWAALWAVDQPLKPTPQTRQPIWLSLGDRSRTEVSKLRQQGFQEIKKANDNSDKVYIDYGEGHTGTATSAYRDVRSYKWLLRRKLGGRED